MQIRKVVEFWFTLHGTRHHEDEVIFSKEMLQQFIGVEWYYFFFTKEDKLKTDLDKLIVTARNVGKSFKVVALLIYLMINEDTFNCIVTRKYAGLTGELYGMFNRVFNLLEDMFEIELNIKWQEVIDPIYLRNSDKTYKKDEDGNRILGKEKYKTFKTVTSLNGQSADCLFMQGKTRGEKFAIFYQCSSDKTKNRIIYFRGADDPDSSRGLAPNVGYIWIIFHEEFSQETDKGKLSFDEQLVRYTSIYTTAKRYITEAINKGVAPAGARVLVIGAANAWDPDHPWIKAMLLIIPESQWREFVNDDLDVNTMIIREDAQNGLEFTRATSLHNEFQFPQGSTTREDELIANNNIMVGSDDYLKAEALGYVFPGFLKVDNPVASIIELIEAAPEATREELKKQGWKLRHAEFGADPGTVDDAGSIETILIDNKKDEDDSDFKTQIYMGKLMVIENKDRKKKKLTRIPNPIMKQMFLDFWLECLATYPKFMKTFLEVNMDMSARALRDDFNYDLFIKQQEKDPKFNGQCVAFPRDERHGFGLEQRNDILQQVIPNTIWDPVTKSYVIAAFKTLEPFAADKSQPHPRKGKMDIYDIVCYGIVKLRANL